MDDLKDSIAKTNELLTELLQRQSSRVAESEARMKEFKDRMPNLLGTDLKKATDEHEETLKSFRSPDREKQMEELRAKSEKYQLKQTEFQDATIKAMEEQNALLRLILEKLG